MRAGRAAVLILLGACLAGCGGGANSSGKAAYEKKVAAVAPSLQGEMLKRRFALEEARVPVLARGLLLRAEGDLRAGIARLQAAKPPSDVASEHAKLIAGYRKELAELKALEPLSKQATTDRFRVAAGKLGRAAGPQEVAAALQAIIAKGYNLGFPAGS